MRSRSIWFLALLLIALLTACGAPAEEVALTTAPAATIAPGSTEAAGAPAVPTEANTPEAANTTAAADMPTTAPEPTLPPVAPSEPVDEVLTFEGAAGLPIVAGFHAPGGSGPFPGVILLHMLGSDRRAWTETGLVDALAGAGYAVLAVDMRGHGETGGAAEWVLAAEDLALVWDAFAARDDVDETRTAVVGGSIGANMALRLAADRPAVRAAVLLSPGLDYRGVTTEDQMAHYGARPILLVASEDDPYSADTVAALDEAAAGASELVVYTTAGHGTNMLSAEPELTPRIVEWLGSQLAAQ